MSIRDGMPAEIEITDEMISAGGDVIETWMPETASPSYCRFVALKVFEAMRDTAVGAGNPPQYLRSPVVITGFNPVNYRLIDT